MNKKMQTEILGMTPDIQKTKTASPTEPDKIILKEEKAIVTASKAGKIENKSRKKTMNIADECVEALTRNSARKVRNITISLHEDVYESIETRLEECKKEGIVIKRSNLIEEILRRAFYDE